MLFQHDNINNNFHHDIIMMLKNRFLNFLNVRIGPSEKNPKPCEAQGDRGEDWRTSRRWGDGRAVVSAAFGGFAGGFPH